jgi:uncharacterized damage-inducible protein DinB
MPGIKKSIFEYKAWANNEIFSLLITIDSSIFSKVEHSAIRVLNHAFVVDEIFRSHLEVSYCSTLTIIKPQILTQLHLLYGYLKK